MVLERAEKMAAAASSPTENEDLVKTGMRLAAEYLKSQETDLATLLGGQPAENQIEVAKGMARTLLRNVILPRNEDLQVSGKLALQGIITLGRNSGDIQQICQELEQILEQYNQHKEQTTQQLDDAIRAQMEQQQMANPSGGDQSPPNPAMHPQYREEMTKMLTSLNNQYNEAMDQRKEMILQIFSPTIR